MTTETEKTTLPAKVESIELDIARIEEATTDEIAATLDAVQWFLEQAKKLKGACDAAMTARVKACGPIQIGKMFWVMKKDKRIKVRNIAKAVEAMLTSVGGDFDSFCQLLAANPLKPGACKQQLNDAAKYDELFETVIDEYAEPKLVSVNTEFLK